MSEAPGPINFTMFLTMFGEKLNGTDPEDVIRNAFACFDEEASGTGTACSPVLPARTPSPRTCSQGGGWGQILGDPHAAPEWESFRRGGGRSCCSALPQCPLLTPPPAVPAGFIHEDHLRELLTTMGDRFTDEEVDEMYREAPIDKKGNFNYVEFTRILKHGAKDKDD